jgi:hypothetical protein
MTREVDLTHLVNDPNKVSATNIFSYKTAYELVAVLSAVNHDEILRQKIFQAFTTAEEKWIENLRGMFGEEGYRKVMDYLNGKIPGVDL